MVSGARFPLRGFRRPLVAFIVTAALVWWLARRDGIIYVIGVDGAASSFAGALLPALSAGLTVALVLSLLSAAARPTAGWVGALVVILLPSFMDVHRASVQGPPLLALMLFMLAAMVHAPRFSFAYGGAAAIMAVFVSPAAVGLPVVAAAWSLLHAQRRSRRRWRRVMLALLPLAAALLVLRWLGTDAWPAGVSLGWRGNLDSALGAAGTVIGDQLAPGVGFGGLRWLIVADTALIVAALVAVAWHRVVAPMAPTETPRRLYEALGAMMTGYASGLLIRTLVVHNAPDPVVADVFPLVVLFATLAVLSAALLWSRWSRFAKLAALALVLGWAGASLVLS